MKKYLLKFSDYDACSIAGIFSSVEKLFDFYRENRYTTLRDLHNEYRYAYVLEFKENAGVSFDHPVYVCLYAKKLVDDYISHCQVCAAYNSPIYEPSVHEELCERCKYNGGQENVRESIWSEWELWEESK